MAQTTVDDGQQLLSEARGHIEKRDMKGLAATVSRAPEGTLMEKRRVLEQSMRRSIDPVRAALVAVASVAESASLQALLQAVGESQQSLQGRCPVALAAILAWVKRLGSAGLVMLCGGVSFALEDIDETFADHISAAFE